MTDALSPRWRAVFLLEVPLCLGTALYWWLGGAGYVRSAWGLEADAAHLGLLQVQAGTLASLLVWTYGRWLWAGVRDLRAFRFLQEGLAIGDVFLVAGAIAGGLRGELDPALAFAQGGMAALWLAVRCGFLLRAGHTPAA